MRVERQVSSNQTGAPAPVSTSYEYANSANMKTQQAKTIYALLTLFVLKRKSLDDENEALRILQSWVLTCLVENKTQRKAEEGEAC